MSLLKTVQTGRKLKPLAIMLHAPHGIGKSTFATEAPDPIYIGDEENDELDVARFPKVMVWKDLQDQLGSLLNETHSYKTLVLDTVDGLETIATKQILDGTKYNSLNTYLGGYGKGGDELAMMFIDIKNKYLVPLREKKGMNIVILCHSKKVKNEEAMTLTSYDHYETALHNKLKPVFEDWVSAILFANYFLVRAETADGKEYAEGADGLRMIYTEERPSHVAKNRFDFPYDIEFNKTGTWEVVKTLVLKHFKTAKKQAKETGDKFSDEANDLKKAIEEKLSKLPEELKVSVESSLKRAKSDVKELKRIQKKVKGILA